MILTARRSSGMTPSLARPCLLAGAVLFVAFLWMLGPASRAEAAGSSCTDNPEQGRLCLSVADTPDPVAYSTFDGNQTYLAYDATVSNGSRSSNLSHVGITENLPAETTFVNATPSSGTCSAADHTVFCAIGQMRPGDEFSLQVVVRAPATADPDPPNLNIANTVTASFDERFSDQTGGKQDSATVIESTLVSATAGQSFIPTGFDGQVGTDPTADQYANASIDTAATDLLATIDVLDPDSFCVNGIRRVGKKNYVCRDGGFVDATVVDADTGNTYSNAQRPLVFHLRWDADLVSDKQTVRNFVVFYEASDTSPLQVIKARCNAGATNLPCVRNIVPGLDGSWSADFVKASNGHMR